MQQSGLAPLHSLFSSGCRHLSVTLQTQAPNGETAKCDEGLGIDFRELKFSLLYFVLGLDWSLDKALTELPYFRRQCVVTQLRKTPVNKILVTPPFSTSIFQRIIRRIEESQHHLSH